MVMDCELDIALNCAMGLVHLPPGVNCLGTRVGLELGVWHLALAVQALYRNLHWI